jgi:hypothetical protein
MSIVKEKKPFRNMYFDKVAIHEIWCDWLDNLSEIKAYNDANEDKKKLPKIPDKLAVKMMEVSTNMSMAHNRRGYSYREDMVSEALEFMCRYASKYDRNRMGQDGKPNPFGYLSIIANTAFNSVWEKEQGEYMVKVKQRSISYTPGAVHDGDVANNAVEHSNSDSAGLSLELHLKDLSEVDTYEQRLLKKRLKAKSAKKTAEVWE